MSIKQAYNEFLSSKTLLAPGVGRYISGHDIHPMLFEFQRSLVVWACRKGRAALFATTGLGKTLMQLEWARLMGERTLIVAPLSVGRQTADMGKALDIEVVEARNEAGATGLINITNYEMLDHFDVSAYGAVVLDESSILKSLDGKTRSKLIAMFGETKYRLCCTATPAPNDIAEIANHAEFLGVARRVDMLARYFVHDDDGWRLKGHAHEAFYMWLASWSMSILKPSDLGFSDGAFDLPPLTIKPVFTDSPEPPEGMLTWTGIKGIGDRAKTRKATLNVRVDAVADMVNADAEPWLVWCGLNDESTILADKITGAIEVTGTDSHDHKQDAISGFLSGKLRVLVTKPKIAGFGLNLQHCRKMVFVGLSDSWEQYFQCIRRCWRYGQTRPVEAYIVLSEIERPIFDNVMAKEAVATEMSLKLIEHVRDYEKQEVTGDTSLADVQHNDEASGRDWRLMLGDSCERLAEITSDSVGLSVFSPPFMSLYTYSPTARDIGNSRDEQQFFSHFDFIISELLRATKPGRNVCCHVAQVPAMLVRDGYIGLKDFRGKTINAFEHAGFIYHGEVCIDKDPQAQAIRTHSKGLLFVQLKKDASWLRPALADYILVFRKPGMNAEPIIPDLTNDEWIEYARPIWYGIRESNTLNVVEARENDDERHICPLQLGTIDRCVRLWSNQGDLVLDPFAGIGSTGYQALSRKRRFVGIELKRAYWSVATKNLRTAEAKKVDLFSLMDMGL